MTIIYKCSGRAGVIGGRGLFRSWGPTADGELFARCPRGKIWPGSAALENAFICGAVEKKFQKAAVPPVPIFQNFPYMEKLEFRYMEKFYLLYDNRTKVKFICKKYEELKDFY
jgi:hypothetical protein